MWLLNDAIFFSMELFHNKMLRILNSVYTPELSKISTFKLKK